MIKTKAEEPIKSFPSTIFAVHYEHSTIESPSLNVESTEAACVKDELPVYVAEYRLMRVRRVRKELREV